MEQKNGWFAFWQKLMKCLSKQDETGVGDTKSVAPVNTIIQSIKGVSSSKEKDSSKVKSLTESVDTFLKSRYDFRYNVLTEETEYRLLERMEEGFAPVNQRVLNTFCLEAHESGVGIVIFHAVFSPPVLQSIILSNFIWKNCRYGMEWTVWRLWHAEFRETNCGWKNSIYGCGV